MSETRPGHKTLCKYRFKSHPGGGHLCPPWFDDARLGSIALFFACIRFFLRDDWTSIKSVLVVLVCTRFDLVGLATLSHRLACSLCITKKIKRCKPLLELSVWMIIQVLSAFEFSFSMIPKEPGSFLGVSWLKRVLHLP